MPRTTASLVTGILNNATQSNWDGATDVTPYIASATNLVNRVQVCATNKGFGQLSDNGTNSEAEILERWLAAHFYCVNDPLYTSRSTQGASGSFQRSTPGEGIASTHYGQQALDLDWTGCLKNLVKQQRINTGWLGRQPREQQRANQRSDN